MDDLEAAISADEDTRTDIFASFEGSNGARLLAKPFRAVSRLEPNSTWQQADEWETLTVG